MERQHKIMDEKGWLLRPTQTYSLASSHMQKPMGSKETVEKPRWISTDPFFLTEQKTKAHALCMLNI